MAKTLAAATIGGFCLVKTGYRIPQIRGVATQESVRNYNIKTESRNWGTRRPRAVPDVPSRPGRCAQPGLKRLALFGAPGFSARPRKPRPRRARSLSFRWSGLRFTQLCLTEDEAGPLPTSPAPLTKCFTAGFLLAPQPVKALRLRRRNWRTEIHRAAAQRVGLHRQPERAGQVGASFHHHRLAGIAA